MNRTGQSLFDALCANPGDDALHLVYADWLEEEGDDLDRAEAIRLQVRRRSLDDFNPEAWVLDTRLERLCAVHKADREAARVKLGGASVGAWPLSTGASANSPQDLLRHQDTIFAAGPVSHLNILIEPFKRGDPIPDPDVLASCKYLNRLRSLGLGGIVPPEKVGIHVLARCPTLSRLKSLDLSSCVHEDDFLEYLATCPAWPSLEGINLYRNNFTASGVRALARAPILASLRSLNLSTCVDARGLRELLRSPHLTGLRSLNLHENGLDSRIMKNLAEYPWQCLERLDLSSNLVKAAGIRHLAGSERMASIRSLDLGGNHDIDDAGVKALAQSPHLGALVDLDLGWWKITPGGLRTLARAPWIGQLRRLRLCGFSAGVAGLQALREVPLRGLRSFEICYADLTDDGLRVLLSAPWVSQLMYLDLNNNGLGTAGAQALAESAALEHIVELTLHHNRIPDEAGELLRGRFGERVVLKSAWG